MKVGMRKPSLKKSISARTTGRLKREVKRAYNPLYGKKGMGYINDPSKAIYNKIYHKTTFGARDILDSNTSNTGNNNLDLNNKGSSVGNVFRLIYYILAFLWNLAKVIFLGAILIGIIYVLIKIIF